MHIISDITVKDGKRYTRYWGFNIDEVEQKYNAKFVCELVGRLTTGNWADTPLAIFYQETPPVEGYTNHFGLLRSGSQVYITSGKSVVDEPFYGIVATDGEIVYSAYRHDFRHSSDNSVFVDGGRDYIRYGTLGDQHIYDVKGVTLKIEGDKIVVIEQPEVAPE